VVELGTRCIVIGSCGAAIGADRSSCVDKSVDNNGDPVDLTVAGCAVVYPIGAPVPTGGESGPPPAKLTPSMASASRSILAMAASMSRSVMTDCRTLIGRPGHSGPRAAP
jgi:hypothetical protein